MAGARLVTMLVESILRAQSQKNYARHLQFKSISLEVVWIASRGMRRNIFLRLLRLTRHDFALHQIKVSLWRIGLTRLFQ